MVLLKRVNSISQVRVPWFHLLLAGSPHDWGYVSEPNYHGALLGYKDTVRKKDELWD